MFTHPSSFPLVQLYSCRDLLSIVPPIHPSSSLSFLLSIALLVYLSTCPISLLSIFLVHLFSCPSLPTISPRSPHQLATASPLHHPSWPSHIRTFFARLRVLLPPLPILSQFSHLTYPHQLLLAPFRHSGVLPLYHDLFIFSHASSHVIVALGHEVYMYHSCFFRVYTWQSYEKRTVFYDLTLFMCPTG